MSRGEACPSALALGKVRRHLMELLNQRGKETPKDFGGLIGTNRLQNDVPEPVDFAYPFSFCIPESSWISIFCQPFGDGRRVGYSFFPVFRSISCHLLMLWGWRPPTLGAPFPCEQPRLECGKSAGGKEHRVLF